MYSGVLCRSIASLIAQNIAQIVSNNKTHFSHFSHLYLTGPERGPLDAAPGRGLGGRGAARLPLGLRRVPAQRLDHLPRLVVPHDEPKQGQ